MPVPYYARSYIRPSGMIERHTGREVDGKLTARRGIPPCPSFF